MTKESRRLTDLVSQMETPAKKVEPKSKASTLVANPAHGEKGDFRKVTITLPPDVLGLLVDEAARRKKAGEKDAQISALIREAVVAMLSR